MRKLTRQLIDRYRHYGDWYSEIAQYIRSAYSDPDLFADLLAATSPRKRVAENWRLANRIYREHKQGLPYSRQGLMPCHVGNVESAISGITLSGNKVRAFAQNLKGDFTAVTVDVWILRYFGVDEKKAISDKLYAKIADRIRRIAKRIGESPAACQAILWTISRFNSGFGGSSFTVETKQAQFAFMGE